MQLKINGQLQTFTSIQTFRKQWDLPIDFQVDYFEPKDWEGLGSMKGADEALIQMKQEVLDVIPETITPLNILSVVDILSQTFRYLMETANEQMGLRYHDIGFAAAGFEDVLRGTSYHLLRLNHTYQGDVEQIRQNFDFSSTHQNWLDASARLSTTMHTYQHGDNQFKVRIVNHIYGRVGLEVQTATEVYYVLDKSLACPGEGYMWKLFQEITQVLIERFAPTKPRN